MFFRIDTEGQETPIPLEGFYGGATRSSCWIVGGGPSLADLPCDRIAASPIPKFCINLAGHGLLRPTIWTAYDPTSRFQKSTYLDASILKILPRGRAMDIVPESTTKVCDAPSTVFFHRDRSVGFRNFLSSSSNGITDWQDSLIQAIDIAFRLGFRVLYFAGCDMYVRPSSPWIEEARQAGIEYTPRELLREFHSRCQQQSSVPWSLNHDSPTQPYHFDEHKPLTAALQTDLHYFRVAQYLRLSVRAISLAGLEFISVTPHSRLNDYIRYEPIESVFSRLSQQIGDPTQEPTRGRYSESAVRSPQGLGPMKDFKPHHWNRDSTPAPVPQPSRQLKHKRLAVAIQEIPVSIREEG